MYTFYKSRAEWLEERVKDLTFAYRETLVRYENTKSSELRWLMWKDLKYYKLQLKSCVKELAKNDTENDDGPASA